MYALFEKLLNPFPEIQPEAPPKSLFAFCLHYSRGAKRYILLMGLFTGLIAIVEVSLYGFIGNLVDWLGEQNATTAVNKPTSTLSSPLWFAGAALLILPLFVFIQSTLLHQTLLGNFPMSIRWQAHRYLLGHSVDYYQNEFAGRLSTKLMQTSLAVRDTVIKIVDVMLYVFIYFISGIVLVASLDWRLAIPFLIWLGLYLSLLRFLLPKLGRLSQRQANARSLMTGRIVDTYTNISTVKLFSHSGREATYAKEGMAEFLSSVHPQMRLATSLSSLVWTISAMLIFSVGAMGIWLWGLSALSTGAIASALALVMRLNGMSHWIMWEVSALFENIGTVRDGMGMLTKAREVQDDADAKTFEFKAGEIAFEHIDFQYGKDRSLIKDLSLNIKAGEKIGLVGRSGAGKSTLVNLLLRFYDIEKGRILIDGQNIASVTQDSLREHIGMVTQDTSLLHRSVRENICYGKPDATDEEIARAVEQANAHIFIPTLEDSEGRTGLEAHVGERGVKLSGGQRQRIAIARVLLKNAPILIMDEATSALDSEVESAIQQNLTTLMAGKTVIAIAHRLSTIAELDRLIVIDEGKIIESGTHQELVDLGGVYSSLWARQSGGFLAEDID